MSLLDLDMIKKGRVNQNVMGLDVGNNSVEYEVEAI